MVGSPEGPHPTNVRERLTEFEEKKNILQTVSNVTNTTSFVGLPLVSLWLAVFGGV